MTSQPGEETIAIHILPNISKSKSNQTSKFGQLTEYNMRNIFLQKSYTIYGKKLLPDPHFIKNQILAFLWINSLKFCTVCILLHAKFRGMEMF